MLAFPLDRPGGFGENGLRFLSFCPLPPMPSTPHRSLRRRLSRRPLDILLQLRLSKESGRDVLGGVTAAVRTARLPWRLHVVNFELGPGEEATASLIGGSLDGAIVQGLSPRIRQALRSFPQPLVLVSDKTLPPPQGVPAPVANVYSDDDAIGRRGARYLLSLGRFRSFGFVTTGGHADRAAGFRTELAAHDVSDIREFVRPAVSGEDENAARLADWLRSLPKPAAVMAIYDEMGLAVLDAAARARLRIPDDLAVLGVDNDALLCETADPPLASLVIDHERLGRLAVEALRRLLARPGDGGFTLLAPVKGVVERQSARPVAPSAALAERAAAFIRRNATKGVSAADVVSHLGVSRSLAALRYRDVFGESIQQAILRVRLDALARRLRESNAPVGELARACGFGHPDHARRLFKARFGRSPLEWRNGPGLAPEASR